MKFDVTEYKDEKCTVRIHRPILSAEEKNARTEAVKKAIVRFYKETKMRGEN
jgi:hypothetical protein